MSKIQCKKCHQFFETLNKDQGFLSYKCTHCGADNKPQVETPGLVSVPPSVATMPEGAQPIQKERCDWELGWRTQAISSFVATVKKIFAEPSRYFETVLPFEDYYSLAAFIYINSFVSIVSAMLFQIGFMAISDPSALMGIPIIACVAFFVPILAVGVTFLFAYIYHLFFVYIGGSKKDFTTTLTVYGLASASGLCSVIPCVGGLIAFVYNLIMNIGGQARAHEISVGRVLLSFLVSILIVGCCFMGVALGIVMVSGSLVGFLQNFGT